MRYKQAVIMLVCIFILALLPMATANEQTPPPSGPYIIEVRVVTPNGTPVEGATVYINTSFENKVGATNVNGTMVTALAYYSNGDSASVVSVRPGLSATATIYISLTSAGNQTQVPHSVTLTLGAPQTNNGNGSSATIINSLFLAGGVGFVGIVVILLILTHRGRKRLMEETEGSTNPRPKRKRSRRE